MPVSNTKTNYRENINKNVRFKTKSIVKVLLNQLGEEKINEIGRTSGLFKRFREIRPFEFLLTFIHSFIGGKTSHLSDILREYNYHNDKTIAYKAWHVHLDKPEFKDFMLIT